MSAKRKKKNKNKNPVEQKSKLSQGIIALIVILSVALLAALITGGILLYKHFTEKEAPTSNSPALDGEPPYADGSDIFQKAHYEIKAESSTNKNTFLNDVKNRDESMESYQLIIRKEGSDGLLEINYWIENDKGCYEYIFDGYDAGVGLDGIYYRTIIDGVATIIDYQTGDYHTHGEFFQKYYQKLSDLTHDILLDGAFSQTYTSIGKNEDGGEVLSNDKSSICVYTGNNMETYIKNGDMGYYVAYGKFYSFPNIEPKTEAQT